jgi:ribosomal protein L37AE/L43A
MKIVCPDCKAAAKLSDDFAVVKCPKCSLDMTYGEYVRYVAYKDKRYRNIMNDYK